MAILLRVAVLATSLAAGSWVGMDRPAIADLSWHGAETDEPTEAPIHVVEAASEPPPLPHHLDPASVPAIEPWPQLNREASLERAWTLAEGPHYEVPTGRRLVTLTFDDGPSAETGNVLDMLARHHVKATFFVIGRYLDGSSPRAERARETLRRAVSEGHLVGNHTHDHALLTTATHAQILDQLDRGSASIERTIGKTPILFRPPYGQLDDYGRAAVRARGFDLVLWSIEKQDMQREDAHQTFRDIVSLLEYKEGGLVLLHDVKRSSIDVLRELLSYLRERRFDPERPLRVGYDVVDLPTYLREVAQNPPSVIPP